jgi:glutamate transport system permease protein
MNTLLYDAPGPHAQRRHGVFGAASALAVAVLLAMAVFKLAQNGQFEADQWEPFTDPDILSGIAEGLLATIHAAATGIALALILGAILAAARLSTHPAIQIPATTIIEFFRATPVLLLILFLFLGFADYIGQFGALVAALTLFNGSVLAEIIRAGILAVPRGQAEAASALGLRKTQVTALILLPQAVRTMLPAIISQCVVALKDTALGFVIAYEELVRTGQLIYTGYHNILPTAFVIGTIYISMNIALSRLATWTQNRTRPGRAAKRTGAMGSRP